MKKLIAFCGLVLATLVGPAGAAPVVTFTPASSHINVGETVTIDVSISGLGAEILSAYDLNFTYNAALLDSQAVTQFDAPFTVSFPALFGSDSNVEGNLGFFLNSLESDDDLAGNQPDSFLLFSVALQGIADGVASFTLGPDADFDRNFVGLDALSLQVAVGAACIAVGTGACATTVPEPSTLALLALVFAGALLSAPRRRSRLAVSS